jgi:CheY-like chemotaxis protein
MSNKIDLKELQHLLNDVSVLYVEDNIKLGDKATHFFEKLFYKVYQARNGRDGLELFLKHRPQIVVTDIEMPEVNGLEMAKQIRDVDKDVKIIITSAYDDKEYLLKTIDIGITGYMIKPIPIGDITQTLYKLAQELQDKKNKEIFNDYLYKIFNNQDNLILMLEGEHVVLVNDVTLDFFGLKDLTEFRDKFKEFGSLLLPHETFLYENGNIKYLDELKENQGKLYNVKIRGGKNELHHLLLKIVSIPDEEKIFILSLHDITQLNLLALFDNKSVDYEKALKSEKNILNLLEAARESQAKINIHNYYKGLTITHEASVTAILGDKIVLKTVYIQQKAVEFENRVILTSDFFPYDIESTDIKLIDFQKQSIEITNPSMMKSSPSKRKYITLKPDIDHTVTLFYNEHKFDTEVSVVNISVNSMRLSLSFLPAGFKIDDIVTVNIVFNEEREHIIIDTQAKIFRIFEFKNSYEVVLILDDEKNVEKSLIDYIAKRQMKLIREFKGLQYEI